MEKFQWVAVAETFIALLLVALVWAFLAGPFHKIAYLMHGYTPHGQRSREGEEMPGYNVAA